MYKVAMFPRDYSDAIFIDGLSGVERDGDVLIFTYRSGPTVMYHFSDYTCVRIETDEEAES